VLSAAVKQRGGRARTLRECATARISWSTRPASPAHAACRCAQSEDDETKRSTRYAIPSISRRDLRQGGARLMRGWVRSASLVHTVGLGPPGSTSRRRAIVVFNARNSAHPAGNRLASVRAFMSHGSAERRGGHRPRSPIAPIPRRRREFQISARCCCARRMPPAISASIGSRPTAADLGHGRLTCFGTEGYMELAKYVDIGGWPGHTIICFSWTKEGRAPDRLLRGRLPYGRQLVSDSNRRRPRLPQARSFGAAEAGTHGESDGESA